MNIKIYAILCGYDKLIGTATDNVTALSLILFAEKMGSYAVSVHGIYNNQIFSGEMLIREAERLFLKEIEVSDFYAA
jgi:hypothetical protein